MMLSEPALRPRGMFTHCALAEMRAPEKQAFMPSPGLQVCPGARQDTVSDLKRPFLSRLVWTQVEFPANPELILCIQNVIDHKK